MILPFLSFDALPIPHTYYQIVNSARKIDKENGDGISPAAIPSTARKDQKTVSNL